MFSEDAGSNPTSNTYLFELDFFCLILYFYQIALDYLLVFPPIYIFQFNEPKNTFQILMIFICVSSRFIIWIFPNTMKIKWNSLKKDTTHVSFYLVIWKMLFVHNSWINIKQMFTFGCRSNLNFERGCESWKI